MAKRKTIGENPLDGLVPRPSDAAKIAKARKAPAKKRPNRKREVAPAPKPAIKERLTVHMPVDVIDRAKNAVYWTPGLTLADLATEAFARAVDQLEKKRGGAFPRRKEELKGGRPLK